MNAVYDSNATAGGGLDLAGKYVFVLFNLRCSGAIFLSNNFYRFIKIINRLATFAFVFFNLLFEFSTLIIQLKKIDDISRFDILIISVVF